MAERNLGGIWNSARVLQELLRLMDDKGDIGSLNLSDDSQYGIKVRRFVAAMKAYGKEQCFSWERCKNPAGIAYPVIPWN